MSSLWGPLSPPTTNLQKPTRWVTGKFLAVRCILSLAVRLEGIAKQNMFLSEVLQAEYPSDDTFGLKTSTQPRFSPRFICATWSASRGHPNNFFEQLDNSLSAVILCSEASCWFWDGVERVWTSGASSEWDDRLFWRGWRSSWRSTRVVHPSGPSYSIYPTEAIVNSLAVASLKGASWF